MGCQELFSGLKTQKIITPFTSQTHKHNVDKPLDEILEGDGGFLTSFATREAVEGKKSLIAKGGRFRSLRLYSGQAA